MTTQERSSIAKNRVGTTGEAAVNDSEDLLATGGCVQKEVTFSIGDGATNGKVEKFASSSPISLILVS